MKGAEGGWRGGWEKGAGARDAHVCVWDALAAWARPCP